MAMEREVREVFPRDVVAVHIGDQLGFYARVEEILPDVKPGWRQFRFLTLTADRKEMTWVLEPRQIDVEPFTMGGTSVRIERLADPVPAPRSAPDTSPDDESKGRVIAFPGRKEKP
jgi:hypothetical protein